MKNTLILPRAVWFNGLCFQRPGACHYQLPSGSTSRRVEHDSGSYCVQVSSVRLPDYLKQPNLVMREDTNELRMANYHSWADNLSDAIQRVVINDANQLNSAYSFVSRCDACPSVTISIEHFYPTRSGQVVLAGTLKL